MVIVNIYLPAARVPEETHTILQNISLAIEGFNSERVIWCGDFNAVLDPNLDTIKKHPASNDVAVRNLLLEWELTDVWRVMHPSTRRYSSVSRALGTLSRLDYFFASPSFMTHVLDTSIRASYRSDHAPLFLQFTLSENERRKCFWKMPEFLVHDTEFRRHAAEDIKTLLLCNEDSPPGLLWDTVKASLCGVALKYMAEMKRIRKKKIEKVETDIAWAVSQRDMCTDSNLILRYDKKVCYLQVELDEVYTNLNRTTKNFLLKNTFIQANPLLFLSK